MPSFIRSATLRLPSEEGERHATWLEIFFDLIFAIIVIQLSARLFKQFTVIGIFQCTALFIPIMWTWASYTVFAARFDNDDAIHWIMTFVIMFAGIIMAIQVPVALEKGAMGFSTGFVIGQMAILLLYLRTIHGNVAHKNITLFYLTGFGLGTLCWILSLFFESPVKFAFWVSGMLIYLSIPWIGKKRILSKAPLHGIYIPERFGAFTIIILGQIIASVVFGLESANWNYYSIITSIMAFTLAILIWVQYYRFIQIAGYKCTLGSGQPYIYTHIPLITSLIVIGVCTEMLIKHATLIQPWVNMVFYFSIAIYMLSFYLLQYIAISKFKALNLLHFCIVMVVISLFLFYPLSSYVMMTSMVAIFAFLFEMQYWLSNES